MVNGLTIYYQPNTIHSFRLLALGLKSFRLSALGLLNGKSFRHPICLNIMFQIEEVGIAEFHFI
jgi:hypothetical protein